MGYTHATCPKANRMSEGLCLIEFPPFTCISHMMLVMPCLVQNSEFAQAQTTSSLNKSAGTFPHNFHIPVMGLGYTVDTPVNVARFGISSVVSIIEDGLLEQLRKWYCEKEGESYIPIKQDDPDHRAKRITAYLNLLNRIVNRQVDSLKSEPFEPGTDLVKYFELLPGDSYVKQRFDEMMNLQEGRLKSRMQDLLREQVVAGSIDVNIMTKCDRLQFAQDGKQLPVEYADAMAALRGYARSDLVSSVVFSAGMNPRLYSYCETLPGFLPDENGFLRKKIILKVSDYRSALIQGKFLAKRGLWVSEYRIESGLNCGGHAFATDGLLAGPILQEFKERREEMSDELYLLYVTALEGKNHAPIPHRPATRITYQGGIGTAQEHQFLLHHYDLDSIGWGSPFLLVPEATNVDDETLRQLSTAQKEDYYLSHASPLGIPFNNFRKSSSEAQRKMRIEKGRPGSPCYKKFLAFNTEFTTEPICTASREYLHLKIKQLKEDNLPDTEFQAQLDAIEEKDCLCEGLGAAALLKNHLTPPHKLSAVSICPGPNLAFFSGIFTLEELVAHIYGKINILNSMRRPNLLVNELVLYVDYLKKEIQHKQQAISAKQSKYFNSFRENLLRGVDYYKLLLPEMKQFTQSHLEHFENDLHNLETEISALIFAEPVMAS
jgi:hypothetical protein